MGAEIGAVRLPPRILLVDHADFLGGAERSALELLKSVDSSRYRVMVATAPGALLDAVTALGALALPLELPKLRGARNALSAPLILTQGTRRLANLIQRERIDIVHSNTMRASLYASAAARSTRAKYLWHVRDLHRSRPYVWMMSCAAHAIIANSQAVARTIPAFARPKTTVVYNGISLDTFDPATASGREFRAQCGAGESDPLIGTVGWLAPWKGHRHFMEAAVRILDKNPRARFVVVGAVTDPRYQAYAQELRVAGERLLGDKLIWAGARSPMQPVLAALDLLLHCADHEPFGRVLIEAMAMQVPVIAFSGGGPDEIIADGESGFLVRPADVDGMASTAIRLVANSEACHMMGRAGRDRVRRLFEAGAVARQVETTYDRLCPPK